MHRHIDKKHVVVGGHSRGGKAGGGRVVLSDGVFLTGPIALKTGVDFHIDKTARLLASPDMADFPDWKDVKHVKTENLPRTRNACVIFADEAERIAITGGGVIDANGQYHIEELPDWTHHGAAAWQRSKQEKFEYAEGFVYDNVKFDTH